ncbi:hypothetical protein [Pseudomonas sp. GD03944]|uniref:hypothetical protein n=1 Tax=Pseudomonas sp. GD03944 TaxID=2975409 RepID=UPI00244CD002|nr:hypothetical protein [Pseudomonas sp. GD03944]MDH1261839.1 hypothetical protein [Pseudomonas sp. GD03944]
MALPFFLGCAKNHNIPPAQLDYLDSSRGSADIYKVLFTSDADISNVFKSKGSSVSGLLRCSLVSDTPNEHSSERYVAKGLISAATSGESMAPFVFQSELLFVENINDGRSYRDLKVQDLREILGARQSVSCVYWAAAYGFKPYRSGILQIPVADIFRELDK